MAAVCKVIRGCLSKKRPYNLRYLSNNVGGKKFESKHSFPTLCVIGGTVTLYAVYKCRHSLCVHTVQAKSVSYLINRA